MSNFKRVSTDTIPCWYELSWNEDQGIILRIHQDFVNQNGPIVEDAPIVRHFAERFKFKKFEGGFEKDFGFNDSLKFLGRAGEFVEFLVSIPRVMKPEGKCPMCGGFGKDKLAWQRVRCLYCDGEGVSMRYDYTEAYAISTSLSALFRYMEFPNFITRCSMPQLITVKTVTLTGDFCGCEVAGEYSREVTQWMQKHGQGDIPEMIAAMQSAWSIMDGGMKSFYEHSFRAYLSNDKGWLCTSCPGNACGLHPDHCAEHSMSRGEGFGFSSHNVDNPQQQIVLLASLAALHDLVRVDVGR